MHVSRRHGPTKRGVVTHDAETLCHRLMSNRCTGIFNPLYLSSLLHPSILGQTRQCSNISPDSCCRGNLILCELMCVSAVIVGYYQLEHFFFFSFPSSSSFPFPSPPVSVSSSSSFSTLFFLLLFFPSSFSFSSPVCPVHLYLTHSQHALLFCR